VVGGLLRIHVGLLTVLPGFWRFQVGPQGAHLGALGFEAALERL